MCWLALRPGKPGIKDSLVYLPVKSRHLLAISDYCNSRWGKSKVELYIILILNIMQVRLYYLNIVIEPSSQKKPNSFLLTSAIESHTLGDLHCHQHHNLGQYHTKVTNTILTCNITMNLPFADVKMQTHH